MALSERLRRIANAIVPFWDALYILQLEEYRVGRLAKWLPRFFFRRNVARRQQLRYTQRAKTIFAASLFLWVLAAVVVATSALPLVVRVGLIGVLCTFGHAFVAAGTWALWPVHHVAALRAMRRAASVVASRKEMRVVAVAGSYGKTTTKQFVYDLARHVLPTQMVPGTINTPRGIAAWILKDLRPSTELLVVEMDAYQVGEIARSCKIAPPDIAVITNVGDQHLERFGSVDRLASALRETIFGSKPTATVVFDEETYSRLGRPDPGGRTVRLVGCAPAYRSVLVATKHLSDSSVANLRLALAVANLVGVPERFVLDSCAKLEPPERRQRHAALYGYDAIDDSYNVSFMTARAGIRAGRSLASSTGKKLLVVTAGIPELGPHERDKNRLLGTMLRGQADYTVVLHSLFAREIKAGIGSGPHRVVADLAAFLAMAHGSFPPSEWVLLLQPELHDLYY